MSAVLLASAVIGLTSVFPAFATTAVGTQNPDLTVSASLASDGGNPDVATVGNRITAGFSVTNNTWKFQEVNLRLTLVFPTGETIPLSVTIYLAPTQTASANIAFTVADFFPKGQYQLATEAANGNGVSSATATISIL